MSTRWVLQHGRQGFGDSEYAVEGGKFLSQTFLYLALLFCFCLLVRMLGQSCIPSSPSRSLTVLCCWGSLLSSFLKGESFRQKWSVSRRSVGSRASLWWVWGGSEVRRCFGCGGRAFVSAWWWRSSVRAFAVDGQENEPWERWPAPGTFAGQCREKACRVQGDTDSWAVLRKDRWCQCSEQERAEEEGRQCQREAQGTTEEGRIDLESVSKREEERGQGERLWQSQGVVWWLRACLTAVRALFVLSWSLAVICSHAQFQENCQFTVQAEVLLNEAMNVDLDKKVRILVQKNVRLKTYPNWSGKE